MSYMIHFNGKTFTISEAALNAASAKIQAYLSSVMNGTGATINFGDTSYNIDAAKLQSATNEFVSHLGTIAGNGAKIVVNGTEYGVDSAKLQSAISEIEAALTDIGEERLEGDGAEYYTLAPTALSFRSTAPLSEFSEVQVNGETVDSANYTLEEGSTIVTFKIDYLKTLNVGSYEVAIVSDSEIAKGGFTVAAPELNEHCFYYNQPYTAYVAMFGENESFFIRDDGTMDIVGTPSGDVSPATYSVSGNTLTVVSPVAGTLTGTISVDGTEIFCNELQTAFKLGNTSIVSDEDYIYIYKEDLGGYEVTAIDKTKAEYGAIKTGINGIDTVAIAPTAFIANITIPNENLVVAPHIPTTVTSIGDNAFFRCILLESMTLPEGILTIGFGAFGECTSLKGITIPNSVTSIGNSAFSWCDNLTSITIPNSVTSIGEYAFGGCSKLTSVIIGDSVTSIGNYVFSGCNSLTDITIGNSVTSIGEQVFNNCNSLTDIIFNGTVAQWNTIAKGSGWNSGVRATYVQCSDGRVSLV